MLCYTVHYMYFFTNYFRETYDVYTPAETDLFHVSSCSFASFLLLQITFNMLFMCYSNILNDKDNSNSPCLVKDSCLKTKTCKENIAKYRSNIRKFLSIGWIPGIFICLYICDSLKKNQQYH